MFTTQEKKDLINALRNQVTQLQNISSKLSRIEPSPSTRGIRQDTKRYSDLIVKVNKIIEKD